MKETINKFELNVSKDKVISIPCEKCQNSTRHMVLASVDGVDSDTYDNKFSVDWSYSYQIVECQGCSKKSFRLIHSHSEDFDITIGKARQIEVLYPKRGIFFLSINDYYNVPPNLLRIYEETINCFNNGNLTLCGAGVRALVEGVCKESGIKSGNVEFRKNDGTLSTKKSEGLQGKINGLYEEGKLTKANAEILHEHRYLGNTAVHDLSIPSREELTLAIEIVENVFDSLYEIPEKGMELKNKRLSKDTNKT